MKNSAPPDLDELWRNFQKKVQQKILWIMNCGRVPKRSPSPGSENPSSKNWVFSIVVIILLAAIWSLTGLYIVDASERAIILRFGRYIEIAEPGLRWHLPYPIEHHELYNVSAVHSVDVFSFGSKQDSDEVRMLTGDENIVIVSLSVLYSIGDARDYAFNNRGSARFLVRQAAQTATREVIGRNKMDYVLYEGREQIGVSIKEMMQQILDRYETGIILSKINLQNVQPPEEVQEAFNDAVKAVQDRERAKNEGQAYANRVLPMARGTSSRILEEASAYKESIVEKADGEAQRFTSVLTVYKKSPQIMRQRIYLDMMSSILKGTNKVLLDTKDSQNNVFYIPLDKLFTSGSSALPDASISPITPVTEVLNNSTMTGPMFAPRSPRGRDNVADLSLRDRGGR